MTDKKCKATTTEHCEYSITDWDDLLEAVFGDLKDKAPAGDGTIDIHLTPGYGAIVNRHIPHKPTH